MPCLSGGQREVKALQDLAVAKVPGQAMYGKDRLCQGRTGQRLGGERARSLRDYSPTNSVNSVMPMFANILRTTS